MFPMQWQYNNHLQPAYRMSYQSQIMLAIHLPHPSGDCLPPFHAGKITDMRVLMDELSTITQWIYYQVTKAQGNKRV